MPDHVGPAPPLLGMAAGTLIVLAVLPGRRGFAKQSAAPGAGTTASEAATVREHTGSTR
ncbi:hypothetical protein ACKI1I_24765 [Streptomyces turgidiscabies]|uniref:Tat pathway signal sequence domain protein n=1 Tax=Streptomyces turgidiscabies (strain Car8) TaxID=698760 RepID=L7EWN6_STRT8|nr:MULTISPECIES: hypothetical protein [Streptomyces]ELP62805.1 Tat pathway signal sequence domain protein [Streptomyces turgidiscabies Car8]MDX3498985.1 hypothetical protein [Streptomyces turgidiscabies]GAQ73433.1 hypothetical protein T45_05191 [Streptomyces turgidiscabies]